MMAVAVLVLLVVVALLGPGGDPSREWYEHTGVEGEIQIIDAMSITRETDPVDLAALPELEDATRGVELMLTEKIVQKNPLNPLPEEVEEGEYGDNLRQIEERESERLVGQNPVELHGQSQQSLTFVLLHVVNPEYPDGIAASVRRLEIIVATHLYVDETGAVIHAYISRNDGGTQFAEAALEAVRQWVYKPVMVDGVATGFWDTIYFVFRVSQGGSIEVETERWPDHQRPG